MVDKKITCISDTHGFHKEVKTTGGDILVFAGDWQYWHDDDPYGFINWLSDQDYKDAIVVLGNHDRNYEGIRLACETKERVHFLHDSEIEICGLRFYGTPWSRQYQSWSYMANENVLDKIFDLIPKNTDVLISHSPAYDVLDRNNLWGNLGSKSLEYKLRYLQIKYHIFGHIHEGYGSKKMFNLYGDYEAINASQCNSRNKLVNKPVDIVLEDFA